MAETTAQTITRLKKALVEKESKLKTTQEVLGVRHNLCKSQAQSISTVKGLITELEAELKAMPKAGQGDVFNV